MSAVTEDWGGPYPEHKITWKINVSGDDAFVQAGANGRNVYRIGRVYVTWEWTDPNEEDAPGKPFVVLSTVDRHGRFDEGKLFLDQLREVPEWLQDIIIRSMPRL